MKICTLFNLLTACAALAQPLPGFVETLQGRRIEATALRADVEGNVSLTTPDGQQLFFACGRYRRAVISLPPELEQARALRAEDRMAEAIPLLETVLEQYRHLGWGLLAAEPLVQHYEALEDWKAVIRCAEAVLPVCPEGHERTAWTARLQQARLRAGETDGLLERLNEQIACAPHNEAGRAWLLRAELKERQHDLNGAWEDYRIVGDFFQNNPERAHEAAKRAERIAEELNQRKERKDAQQ